MTDQPADPTAIADDLIAAVEADYASAGVTLPTRRIVIAGTSAAWDCEQLTVNLQRLYVGLPGQEAGSAVPWQRSVMSMQLLVQLVRKAQGTLANAPRGRLPSSSKLEADAAAYFRDARLLAGALHAWQKSKPNGSVKAGPVVPTEQQGEYVGLSAFVDVLLA